MQAIRQTVNRAKEAMEEKFGDPLTTPYDIETQRIIKLSEDLKCHDDFLSAMQAWMQQDPTLRVMPGMMGDGLNKPEQLAKEMGLLGKRMSSVTGYGTALMHTADAFNLIGRAQREYLTAVQTGYLLPMKRLLHEDMKPFEKEVDKLASRRLELDAVKNNSKGNQGYSQPPELEKAQRAFDEQQERVKQMGRRLEENANEMEKTFKNFVEHQKQFFCVSAQALGDAHKNL